MYSYNLTSFICFLLCYLTLVLICTSKTWKTLHQRLFLYLTALTTLYLTILTLHIEHYFGYTGQDKFCVAFGFLGEYAGMVQEAIETWMKSSDIMEYVTHRGKRLTLSSTPFLPPPPLSGIEKDDHGPPNAHV